MYTLEISLDDLGVDANEYLIGGGNALDRIVGNFITENIVNDYDEVVFRFKYYTPVEIYVAGELINRAYRHGYEMVCVYDIYDFSHQSENFPSGGILPQIFYKKVRMDETIEELKGE